MRSSSSEREGGGCSRFPSWASGARRAVSPRSTTVKAAEHALAEWRAAGRDEEEARKAQAGAAARRRGVVLELRKQRYSAADVGRVLGISKQRVYQLEKAES